MFPSLCLQTVDLLPLYELSSEITISSNTFPEEMNFHPTLALHPPPEQQHNNQQQQQQYNNNFQYPDHLQSTPCLEDLDTEYGFEVEVPVEERAKALWYYDPLEKRLFVKGDQSLSAVVSWRSSNVPLYVRLMPVYTTKADLRRPVYRCANHKDNCKSAHKEHIVHCHNEGAMYVGKEHGESFSERLSIVIPLRKSQHSRQFNGEMLKEEIVFSFTCLNSCSGISRRPTAVIFTLENHE